MKPREIGQTSSRCLAEHMQSPSGS